MSPARLSTSEQLVGHLSYCLWSLCWAMWLIRWDLLSSMWNTVLSPSPFVCYDLNLVVLLSIHLYCTTFKHILLHFLFWHSVLFHLTSCLFLFHCSLSIFSLFYVASFTNSASNVLQLSMMKGYQQIEQQQLLYPFPVFVIFVKLLNLEMCWLLDYFVFLQFVSCK